MWFSSSNLFPPPSNHWLQNALSDPKGLGWGGEGQPSEKGLKTYLVEKEEREEESILLSLLDRGNLEDTLGPDSEAGVSSHAPQGDGQVLEAIKTKLQEMEKAHERQELKGMEETKEQPSQEEEKEEEEEEEKEETTEGLTPLSSKNGWDAETGHLLSKENGTWFPGIPMEKLEADQRSVYVGNVDYSGTAEELESHFSCCGEINRITILCDKYSGHPKGYAYIEFAYEDSVKTAMDLDETTFRGRIIKVLPKRTNFPGISTTDRGGLRTRLPGRGGPHRCGLHTGDRSRPRGGSHRGYGRFSQWFKPY